MTSPVSAIGATPGTVPTPSSVAAANQNTTMLDPQAFLQLLVAQLKYQDPSSPMDTSAFMNQTAMLSQVQTMNSMSSTLSALSDAQQAQAATGLIGKTVTYLDANGQRASGVVDSAQLLATGATLDVGTATIPLSGVLEVTSPGSSGGSTS